MRKNSKSLRKLQDCYCLHFQCYFGVNDLKSLLEAKLFFASVFIVQSFSK
jgi:hypothetical protein